MRGFGVLLFAGMVFLAGAAYWAMSGREGNSIRTVFEGAMGREIQTKTLPPPAPLEPLEEINRKKALEPARKIKVAASKVHGTPASAPVPAPEAVPPAEVVPPPPVRVPEPPPPFPKAGDLPAGALRGSVEQSFGAPYLKTMSVQRGGVVETWVYVEEGRKLATFAHVQNGRIIASSTNVY